MMIITPDIVNSFTELKICSDDTNRKTIAEHRLILEMISKQNPQGAVDAMEEHLNEIKKLSNTFK